jgi:hypothetical protein
VEREGQNDVGALATIVAKALAGLRSSIPATVIDFDAATQAVTARPNIRAVRTLDGVRETLGLPDVLRVPLVFPYAHTAGWALTLPIQAGDQVLLVVADRSIDNWVDNSGVQDPHESVMPRTHDLTDSLAIIGATPAPLALANYQTGALELRNAARDTRVTLQDSLIEIVQAGASVVLTPAGVTLTFGGSSIAVTTAGVAITGALTINGAPYVSHVHSENNVDQPNTGGVVV